MPEQNSNPTFGHYLKSKREEAGLDLEYIFRKTRITPEILEYIENEDHEKLPEAVYVKGFIRAYAEVLDAEADGIIHNYAESRRNYMDITQLKTGFARKREGFWPRFIVGAMVMATIISIVALAVSYYQDRFRSETVKMTDPAEKNLHQTNDLITKGKISEQPDKINPDKINQEAYGSLTEENVDEQEGAFSEIKPGLLNLSISATAATWLKVIIDGEKPSEYLLKPGDKIALNANLHYNLLIGNAGGLQLNLNGQPVQIPGRMGQIVNLTLP
jgi:cytoskeleton protein RodZ